MDKNIIYSLNNSALDFDIARDEILRYMASGGDESSVSLIDGLLPEATGAMSPAASFVRLDFELSEDRFAIGNIRFESASLAAHIAGCGELVVLSLSLGHALDRLIAKYSALRPSAAFCINAIGAAAAESYADMICRDISAKIAKEGLQLSDRFSPGYGDLPLELQQSLLTLSDARRRVGIALNKSLIMSPSKSITAIMGISSFCIKHEEKTCKNCGKIDCIYRKQANNQ